MTDLELLFILDGELGVHGDFRRLEGRHLHKLDLWVSTQLTGQPQERLLKVVVALGTDVIVLAERE